MSGLSEERRTLGFLLREGSRLMRRRFVHHIKETGLPLNRSEASLLVHVFHEPGINQARVANLLDVETISIARLVDGLEQAGLIERRPHATDRRFRTLWLTPAGEEAVARIRRVAETVRNEALEGISPSEYERLVELLGTIRGNLLAIAESAGSAAA